MKFFLTFWVVILAATFAIKDAKAAVITIDSTLTANINDNGFYNFNSSDRLVAYFSDGTQLNGFMKFDLSALADDVTINSVQLIAYTEGAFGAPANNPLVQISYVSDDAWGRAANTSLHSTIGPTISSVYSAFSAAADVQTIFSLNVNAFNFAADLLDNTLSLVMRNPNTAYSYMYFRSSNINAPQLVIDYTPAQVPPTDVPEPTGIVLLALGLLGLRRLKN